MTGTSHSFVEWREEFVSQERGNRVVHYFLKDSSGESILAVVGTERSVRHMFYVVSEEFLQVYGKESSIHAGYKWRSRREVVDWLTSMLSKQHLHGGSELPKFDPIQPLGSPNSAMDGMGAPQTQAADDTGHIAIFKGHHPDIVWSGVAWKCGKQLKHYPSFCRNGTTIAIQSFVFVMAKGENHYLAYLEDMYEDKRGQKKVKVRWFHYTQEVEGIIPIRNPHPKEVFMTPYVQVISTECVDGPATVLTREHYEKCISSFPHPQCTRIHLCYRQFRNNRVKPFDLSKLRGYFDQPILSCLVPNPFSRPESICLSLTGEEAEQLSSGENVKVGAKRTRSGRACRTFSADHSGVRNSVRIHQTITYEPYENLDYSLSGSRRLLSLKHVGCHLWYTPLFKVDEKIELLCHDSGIRGCWFRCTVLQVSRKQMKVQYDDVQDEDGYGNLEEWIPTFKMAMPDKLGMRHLGRPAIRPAPPNEEQVDLAIEVGTAVDAWWSDGWWEGVVTGLDDSGDSTMRIYFPGESILLNVQKKDLRKSKDWMEDRWVDIQGKPDILSALSATIGLDSKLSPSSNIAKDIKSGVSLSCADSSTRFNNVVDEKLDLPAVASSDGLPEDMERVIDNKSPPLNDKGNRFDRVDTKGSCNNVDDVQGDEDDDNDKHDNDGESGDDTQNFDSGQNCKAELMEPAGQDVQ